MTTSFCCEICWRYRTCGNDCGSCDVDDEERDPVNGQLVSARVAAVNRAADVLAEIISGELRTSSATPNREDSGG